MAKYFRFVAHIVSDLKDIETRLALREETAHPDYKLMLCEITEERFYKKYDTWTSDPNTPIYLYQGTIDDFKKYAIRLKEALENPVLHAEDFAKKPLK